MYDVVVIGSGYGGAIAASRAARAGQKVCVLERGKEWRPGDFPETEIDAVEEVQMTTHDNPNITGKWSGVKLSCKYLNMFLVRVRLPVYSLRDP